MKCLCARHLRLELDLTYDPRVCLIWAALFISKTFVVHLTGIAKLVSAVSNAVKVVSRLITEVLYSAQVVLCVLPIPTLWLTHINICHNLLVPP